MANNQIQEKLRKLIEHQKSASAIGNLFEAMAFADKIQELLDKHNLSMSDIDMTAQDETMGRENTKISLRFTWRMFLLQSIAETNGCRLFVDRKKFAVIVGTEDDRRIVTALFDYFADLGDSLLTVYRKEHRANVGTIGNDFNKSFLHGFQLKLGERLRQQHRMAMENAQTSTALVFIGNKLAKVDAFVNSNIHFGEGKTIKMRVGDWNGYNAGVRAGNSVALTNQRMPTQNNGGLLGG